MEALRARDSISLGEGALYSMSVDEEPYITGYEPIKDASGKVIGAYYVGYKK
ncbi:MAG TPA: cache domain-containing protein [Burkholderiaceae bacterium]|nr:cache domain-containing protein [Burkholderiaceae bacterium]